MRMRLSADEILDRRIQRALGTEPLEDARHLMTPLSPNPSSSLQSTEDSPQENTEFVLDIQGRSPLDSAVFLELFSVEARKQLSFPRVWMQDDTATWHRLNPAINQGESSHFALSWELTALLSEGVEMVRDLSRFSAQATALVAPLNLLVIPREEPIQTAARAAHLLRLRTRFARAVQMRLLPLGRTFPSRGVWRCAYALGLSWGALEQFHWHDSAGQRRFTLSGLDTPGYFLPERAEEGEARTGLALTFDLPEESDPLAVYDHMALALDYLRQRLNGRPVTVNGSELDGERLYEQRDQLEAAVQEMARAGIAPGSKAARRFF